MGCICCDDMEIETIGLDELVRASIDLLDAKGPADWRTRIVAVDLDINNVSNCVLGQLFGEYRFGVNALEIDFNDRRYAFMPNEYTPEDMLDEWLEQLAI